LEVLESLFGNRVRINQQVAGRWRAYALVIGQLPGRQRHPQGVQDGQNIDDFLGDRAGDRRQQPGGGQDHAPEAQGHPADGALEGDGPQPPADVQELVHPLEVGVQRDRPQDSDRDGDQERARRGHDDDGQESHRVAGPCPRGQGEGRLNPRVIKPR
jgi:hypothetical protein